MTIRCFYSCTECGLSRQLVDVTERDPTTHDVTEWLENVAMVELAADHLLRSRHCTSSRFAEVGIPIDDGTEYIGARTTS